VQRPVGQAKHTDAVVVRRRVPSTLSRTASRGFRSAIETCL
jgi:hypothetical protein